MDLDFGRMERGDIAACIEMLRGHAAYVDDVLPELAQAWARLLSEKALITLVIRDPDREGQSMLAFAAGVFVEQGWVDKAEAGLEPGLGLRTIRADQLNATSPVLRPNQFEGTSNRGLCMLNLHYAEARDLDEVTVGALRYKAIEAFLSMFRGYKLAGIWQEFWDEIDPNYIYNGWGQVRTEYAPYYERLGQPMPAVGKRPVLTALTREEALAAPGNLMAPAFFPASPRFGFTVAEKRLLHEAMKGSTDEELARALNRALPTVKSHWRSIYQRVEDAAPGLMVPGGGDSESHGRGREKRRLLISYLSRHPEEL